MMDKLVATAKRCCAWAGILLFLNGCGSGGGAAEQDGLDHGVLHISVDESFRPVIDEQIKVFEASYPDAKIVAHYKPEAECLKDLAVDSIRMIITTRGVSKAEEQFIIDSLKLQPEDITIAYDAIAVIVHPAATDSFFTMQEISDLVTGKTKNKLMPVFDGVRATSTVRYMMDSVLKGGNLGANVTAAQNSEGVIDYVSKNPAAVGFVGVSWVGNQEDSAQLSFLQKVKMARLESTDNPGGYVLPVQANIYGKRYPMVRDLVYVIKERHRGIAHGFANFLRGNRGQLIFRRAYLVPGQQSFFVRPATLN